MLNQHDEGGRKKGVKMTVQELREQIAQELNINPVLLTDDAGPKTIEEWDSMGGLGIISVLDRVSKEPLSIEDTEPFTSFGAVVAFARAKGIVTD